MRGWSPQRSPVRSSSKLALMKKREEEGEEPQHSKMTSSPTKVKISPKKEPMASANQDKKVKGEATSNSVEVSPQKPEVRRSKTNLSDLELKANMETPIQCSPLKCDQSWMRSPEDTEKRKVNATAYRNYLNRDGPRALGSKQIPQVTAHLARNPSCC